MAADASEALGAPQVAGTLVAAKGLAKKMTARVAGGQIGGLVGTLAATAANAAVAGRRPVPDVPSFGSIGYLAASPTDLAVTRTRTGWTPKPTGPALALVPRSEIASVHLRRRYMSRLTIQFQDGKVWEFDIARAYRSSATGFVQALGGTIDRRPAVIAAAPQ